MITQTHPRGNGRVSEKTEFEKFLGATKQSSHARGHVGGGGD